MLTAEALVLQASRKESAELQLQRCAHLRAQLEAELQVLTYDDVC